MSLPISELFSAESSSEQEQQETRTGQEPLGTEKQETKNVQDDKNESECMRISLYHLKIIIMFLKLFIPNLLVFNFMVSLKGRDFNLSFQL